MLDLIVHAFTALGVASAAVGVVMILILWHAAGNHRGRRKEQRPDLYVVKRPSDQDRVTRRR